MKKILCVVLCLNMFIMSCVVSAEQSESLPIDSVLLLAKAQWDMISSVGGSVSVFASGGGEYPETKDESGELELINFDGKTIPGFGMDSTFHFSYIPDFLFDLGGNWAGGMFGKNVETPFEFCQLIDGDQVSVYQKIDSNDALIKNDDTAIHIPCRKDGVVLDLPADWFVSFFADMVNFAFDEISTGDIVYSDGLYTLTHTFRVSDFDDSVMDFVYLCDQYGLFNQADYSGDIKSLDSGSMNLSMVINAETYLPSSLEFCMDDFVWNAVFANDEILSCAGLDVAFSFDSYDDFSVDDILSDDTVS